MKAVFKKTAFDKLREIIHEAERNRKKIDYLLLTPEEMDEVKEYCVPPWLSYDSNPMLAEVSVRVVERKSVTGDPFRTYRFMVSPFKFIGHDIVVAPAEYH